MTHSEQIDKAAEALAKAEGEIENAVKAAENPGFKRGNKAATYADLASVWDAIRAPLARNGIAVVQAPQTEGQRVTVTTMLIHASGQWFRDELSMTAGAPTPQAIGSAITYARRYALSAMVGVAPADDDGNAASGVDAAAGRPEHPEPAKEPPKTRTETLKTRVAAANGHASPPMPKDAEARKLDLKARTQALGFKGPDVAKKIGEWIGRECDGATTITTDDWLKADAGITAAKTTKTTLEAAGLAGELL